MISGEHRVYGQTAGHVRERPSSNHYKADSGRLHEPPKGCDHLRSNSHLFGRIRDRAERSIEISRDKDLHTLCGYSGSHHATLIPENCCIGTAPLVQESPSSSPQSV